MNESIVDRIDVTTKVYAEAMLRADTQKKDQVLFIWNVTEDSYYYEIVSTDENIPAQIEEPYITRHFTYKEKAHE